MSDEPPDVIRERILAAEARAYQAGLDADQTAVVRRAVELGLDASAESARRHRRETALACLVDAARDLTASADPDDVLGVVTRRARQLLRADVSYVAMPDPGDTVRVLMSDGWFAGPEPPGDAVPAGLTPFWTPDFLADRRIRRRDDVDKVISAGGLRGMVAVPLSGTGGTLCVGDRAVRHFTAEEVAPLVTLGELAGAALTRPPGRIGGHPPLPGEADTDLLGDLLAHPRALGRLDRRARSAWPDLTKPHVVVLIQPEGGTGNDALLGWASMRAHRAGGLATVHDGAVVMLLPGADAGVTARQLLDEVQAIGTGPVTISGAGPVTDAAAVHDGYLEAVRCLEAMGSLGLSGRAACASELGFFGVLLSDRQDAETFVRNTIGAVLDYDERRMTELVRTLEAYFDTGSSPTYAAQRLHVHANTVARRMERVTELLGSGWQKPERALEIQLALRLARIRRLVQQRAGGEPSVL